MPPLPPLREVIARHGLAARKGLGQHFLFDENLTRRIVRGAGALSGHTAIEIGPGLGGLTRALVASEAREGVAVEIDTRRSDECRGGTECVSQGRSRCLAYI